MNSIRRNKIIIATAAITLVAVIFCWILTHSSFNGTFSFHCVHNQNTGEPLSIWTSIMLYILLFLFLGMVPSGVVMLFVELIYVFLHIKDKHLFRRRYHPPYEEEFYFGASVAFKAVYIAIFILMILHISNLVSIYIPD